jgi:hypothetical protein
MNKDAFKTSGLLIPAIWFAATSVFAVVMLDLIMTDSALINKSFIERLHFTKDIFVISAAVLSGAVISGYFYKKYIAKELGDFSLGLRLGLVTAFVSLAINPVFWLLTLSSFLLFPFLALGIFLTSGIIFGIFHKFTGLRPNNRLQSDADMRRDVSALKK